MNPLARFLDPLPLIAVLRGVTPEEIPEIGSALVSAGFRAIVPYLRGYGPTRFLSSATLRSGQQEKVPTA